MKVRLAKTAGFCFGVKRAVNMVHEAIGEADIYTYGPIIHNEQVVTELEKKGVKVLYSLEDLDGLSEGTVVIRSHGIPKSEYDAILAKGLKVIDATCPFVKKIHEIVVEQGEAGRDIVIIGNKYHPEVKATSGWCVSPFKVIENVDEAYNFSTSKDKKLCIVSQTTFNYNKFEELVEIISKKGYDINCLNTICNATEERQAEARIIAAQSDAMIVIGDKHSSNTQKLYGISKKQCKDTYYIQTLVDLDLSKLGSINNVGITAGASTPNKIIEEVHKACQK